MPELRKKRVRTKVVYQGMHIDYISVVRAWRLSQNKG